MPEVLETDEILADRPGSASDPCTAVSLLDRLLHHASAVVTDGDSYRMREARARKGTTLNKT